MDIFLNKYITTYLEQRRPLMALQGARRAGKTYTTCQWLLLNMYNDGDVVIFASMTSEQGRKGAYEDCKNILQSWGALGDCFEVLRTPREIRCKRNNTTSGREGVAYFSSFQDPETAKGGACDWVFINEANKFTKQQYLDLAANARKGVILDFNPNVHFWVEEVMKDEDVLKCSWQNNRKYLTQAQLDWFQQIYDAAHKEGATSADWYYYLVYYEGQYSELAGTIFTRANIHVCKPENVPQRFENVVLFADPSALRGADWFPLVLAAMDEQGEVWVLDVSSVNDTSKEERLRKMQQMAAEYDRVQVYVEANGLVGIEFQDFCISSNFDANYWTSRGNKFQRIIAHYQEITTKVHFIDSPMMGEFLKQVYEFAEKCEHDDNIDAVNSALMILQYQHANG